VRDSAWLADFRALFGDERATTRGAVAPLRCRRARGVACLLDQCLRGVASVGDWAETWAHYLHMIDTLETAEDYELTIHREPVHCAGSPALAAGLREDDFERLFGTGSASRRR